MLDLLDYRRRVFEMYRIVRQESAMQGIGAQAYQYFRRERDALFREHPQSALDAAQKAAFRGLRYYNYDPAYRVMAALDTNVEPVRYEDDLESDGRFTMRLIGQVTFELPSGSGTLGVYWIGGYGGGLFLPFRDATNGSTTYGGGRYLYDTIKGADLGVEDGVMTLDFNYAYHPSCCYHPRWVCPLAPPQNRLACAVEAGEMLPDL